MTNEMTKSYKVYDFAAAHELRPEPGGGRLVFFQPAGDDERLPIMKILDQVLCGIDNPPMRTPRNEIVDIDCTEIMEENFFIKHFYNEITLSHLIERHIMFVTVRSDMLVPVALQNVFIRHYMSYRESALRVFTPGPDMVEF